MNAVKVVVSRVFRSFCVGLVRDTGHSIRLQEFSSYRSALAYATEIAIITEFEIDNQVEPQLATSIG